MGRQFSTPTFGASAANLLLLPVGNFLGTTEAIADTCPTQQTNFDEQLALVHKDLCRSSWSWYGGALKRSHVRGLVGGLPSTFSGLRNLFEHVVHGWQKTVHREFASLKLAMNSLLPPMNDMFIASLRLANSFVLPLQRTERLSLISGTNARSAV